jgi:hypothetical protein
MSLFFEKRGGGAEMLRCFWEQNDGKMNEKEGWKFKMKNGNGPFWSFSKYFKKLPFFKKNYKYHTPMKHQVIPD